MKTPRIVLCVSDAVSVDFLPVISREVTFHGGTEVKLGIAITVSVLVVVCSFLLGWLYGKPKPEPQPTYPHFQYHDLHEHTHEGGKHRGVRSHTPLWGPDYDFQYDRHGTHTHKHSESDVTLTHGHCHLDKMEPATSAAIIGVDHTHSTLSIQSKSENWRSSNGDWVHDHYCEYIPAMRTLLYITHSHL